MAPAIEFRDVSYQRHSSVRILDRLTLSINAGEVLALVGRSGAGKTTVLRLVNRLLLPDSGAVLVEGRSTRDWEPIRLRRSIGYVIQDVGLFPHMSVADNIAVVPRLERWDVGRVATRIRELLELIGLPASAYADRWPDELSGGQRQRVGVARALAVRSSDAADGRAVRRARSGDTRRAARPSSAASRRSFARRSSRHARHGRSDGARRPTRRPRSGHARSPAIGRT